MGTAKNLGILFLHSSFSTSKMIDCTLQEIFHKVQWWWKAAFYSEGLFTEVQFNYSFLLEKRVYCQCAPLAVQCFPPSQTTSSCGR